ncbi:hypothetical protein HDV05_006518 [Chytridiales sp. JEL 0842]|nr:hypothetical protein HDV05_006518 [Chytridiales sp. JEL 0842]
MKLATRYLFWLISSTCLLVAQTILAQQQQQRLLPDFAPDASYLAATLSLDWIDGDRDPCLIAEKCLSGPGMRRVLRFGTRIHNIGTADAYLGSPPSTISPENPRYWYWDTCHRHWHFTAYAQYDLLSSNLAPVVAGAKSGFCLEDFSCPEGIEKKYTCANQGITAGCADVYDDSLRCQWIDITELVKSPGFDSRATYYLRVAINRDGFFPELEMGNNVITVPVVLANLQERRNLTRAYGSEDGDEY